MIRIAIADDHPVVREGVKRILADTRDLQVVGEARTGQELFAIVADQPCDMVLLDLLLPDQNGLKVLQELNSASPRCPWWCSVCSPRCIMPCAHSRSARPAT